MALLQSFRLRELVHAVKHSRAMTDMSQLTLNTAAILSSSSSSSSSTIDTMANHPDFLHLAGLVSEAVLEVVFVALPGFLAAWSGMFPADAQKFVAELNTMVFTPCLIFTKLASQLNAEKLSDLVIIPFIFAVLTLVSYVSAWLMANIFGFRGKKRQKNFILAMGVFGNSNSLPISLVISLSKTITGLHWDKVPGDNDDEVAARGILYLLIFQQLGQLLRWTWGYSVLLKPAEAYEEEERQNADDAEEDRYAEEGGQYRDDPDDEEHGNGIHKTRASDSGFSSSPSTMSSSSSMVGDNEEDMIPATSANGNNLSNEPRFLASRGQDSAHRDARSTGHITNFPEFASNPAQTDSSTLRWKTHARNSKAYLARTWQHVSTSVNTLILNLLRKFPVPVQRVITTIHSCHMGFWKGVWRQMNPPLWAMLAALVVASIPSLQKLFFTPGTFVNNSITRAITQTGGVAVPLILVVLGANLARSTLPKDQLASTPEEKAEERRLLYASLIARMVLPTIVMTPILFALANWVPISILDDPIFLIVCFLLAGAPSALQLAQICQINNVFMGAMSNLLVASYVVVIFPSTLVLVLLALETLEWAQVV